MLKILTGDCLAILPTLPAQSVQCCITSPPYWGLRDYGTAAWDGGSAECDHIAPNGQGKNGDRADRTFTASVPYRDLCGKCGARRIDSQIGLESTPEEYLAKMVSVFREVKRVLRDDGTLWVNMGDSYAGGHTTYNGKDSKWQHGEAFRQEAGRVIGGPGLKPKDLCMMPARLAMALQSDGWYLRSDIIWHKPNPMPESVTDRPTKAHEYIFLLAKQERYFYDADAIREEEKDPGASARHIEYQKRNHSERGLKGDLVNHSAAWGGNGDSYKWGRNKRTVWTVATAPFSDAHFATFPPDLIKPCILAGSRLGDTVLDPFFGSGTTGMVAIEIGRKAIGIELNPEYIKMAEARCQTTPGLPLTLNSPSAYDTIGKPQPDSKESLLPLDFQRTGKA